MPAVRVIQARTFKDTPITRVAIYARVSSFKDAAEQSLENQVESYTRLVEQDPLKRLVGIFAEEGITGTSETRPEFLKLLDFCRTGAVDLIITKSITRFARNTVMLLKATRELKSLGVDVYFEKEHLHTNTADGEFVLSLLAMYAEEESRSASENQLWRIRRKYQAGEIWTFVPPYGYRFINRELTIYPEEAKIVKRIFTEFVNGKTLYKITKDLSLEGVPAKFSRKWSRTTLGFMLRNVSYIGDLLLQKSYTEDYRTKKRINNNGERPKYYVADHHEPIVSKEIFELAQQRLDLNVKQYEERKMRQAKPDTKHLFAGFIKCNYCGYAYTYRRLYYRTKGYMCSLVNYNGKSACKEGHQIPEKILIQETAKLFQVAESEVTREFLESQIKKIIAPEKFTLLYQLKDGREIKVKWQLPSRSESWTPEMRAKAAEKTRKRYEAKRKAKETQQAKADEATQETKQNQLKQGKEGYGTE